MVPYRDQLLVMLKLDPDSVALEAGFSRNVRDIGKLGTGDLELTLRSRADLERALPLLERSYNENWRDSRSTACADVMMATPRNGASTSRSA